MYHKDLCKGFIEEKSFVLGESTIKDIQKRFNIYKDLEIFPNNDSLYITKIEEKEGFITLKILLQPISFSFFHIIDVHELSLFII